MRINVNTCRCMIVRGHRSASRSGSRFTWSVFPTDPESGGDNPLGDEPKDDPQDIDSSPYRFAQAFA